MCQVHVRWGGQEVVEDVELPPEIQTSTATLSYPIQPQMKLESKLTLHYEIHITTMLKYNFTTSDSELSQLSSNNMQACVGDR